VPHIIFTSRKDVSAIASPHLISRETQGIDTMSTDPHRSIRHDLLWRLRWNVSSAVEDTEIQAGPYDQAIDMPFLGHPLGEESLSQPPLSCIDAIHIGDFADKEDRDIYLPKEEGYQPPAPFRIENKDGSAITLGQFVTEVHAYVGENMEELKKIKGATYGKQVIRADGSQGRDIVFGRPATLPDTVPIFFNKVWATDRGGQVWITVKLHVEGESFYPSGFWAPRLLQVRNYEAQR
jgi:hypothetical protein